MDIIIEELPIRIIELFEKVDQQGKPSLDIFEMFITEFKSYLREEVLREVNDRYINETILFHSIYDIYMKFKKNKQTIENEWWNRLLCTHQKRAQAYDCIFDKIIEKEQGKGNRLTEHELFEIENGFREELFAPHHEKIFKNRIYDAIGSAIFFSDYYFVDFIYIFSNSQVKEWYRFSSFEYRGRTFEIFKPALKIDLLEDVNFSEKGLTRLPINWYPQNKPNKPRRCPIFKKGEYLEDFEVDLSLIDLRRINVRKIENINYVLLFLKKYAEEMDEDYLYRLNFEILKRKIEVPSKSFQKNYQLLKKLRKKEVLDFGLALFKEKVEEFLIEKVIDDKIQLSRCYLDDLLEQYQKGIRVKLHPQAYLACYTKAKEWIEIQKDQIDLDEACSKIIKDEFDEDLWDGLVGLVEANEHLLAVKPCEKVGRYNYNRWKTLQTDQLALLNVKTIGLYGIENKNGVYRNVHGVEIDEYEFQHYQSINFRLATGSIFPNTYPYLFSCREEQQAYKNLFGPHEFYVVKYAVEDFLHVKASKVISESKYMLNAFLTAEEFAKQYQKLRIIEEHLAQMGNLQEAKVEDYYINWEEVEIQ